MKTKSIWGNPPTRLYRLIDLANKTFDNQYSACIVGCSDGKFLLPFARKRINVTGYDIDDIALNGGNKLFPVVESREKYNYSKKFVSKDYKLENKMVIGVNERLEIEGLKEFAKIEKRDFYKNVPKESFDVVFTSCSLHYTANKGFSLKEKTQKLKDIVNEGGFLYIDYMMAIDEKDCETYPKEKFYRKGEIKQYFENDWEIISCKENNHPSFEGAHVDCVKDHFHRFGYILAKRKKK